MTFGRRNEPDPLPAAALREAATPLDERSLADLAANLADRRVVLLGEASHGTSEFYSVRADLSRRLIERHGFSFVAVEGDWPACRPLHAFVAGEGDGDVTRPLQAFDRWPAWMWANWEVADFAAWLREHNAERRDGRAAGFFGLDVYSLHASLDAVLTYLREHRPDAADAARRAFACFEPYREAGEFAGARLVPEGCEDEVVELLRELRTRSAQRDGAALFDAEQNALVALNADRYYRAALRGGGASWNVRDRHMQDTLERLLAAHDPNAKAIVWAHNTHVGDARFTDMGPVGMVNLGQLSRERLGRDRVAAIGFGTHRGTVLAGSAWGAPQEVMDVPSAAAGSWEDEMHRAGLDRALLASSDLAEEPSFRASRGHRAIGVVYRPERERFGNYVPTVLPERYDAFVFLDRTHALHPVGGPGAADRPPDTFPWAL